MREFEQMEMQFFVRPGRNEALRILERSPFKMALGLGKENYRFHDHEKLAHYANACRYRI
jgi:glycyl-tRNA synthetase